MKLLSINVGQPRQVVWKGKTITTGIYKEPVAGPVQLHQLNLKGDGQADLSVHGGPDRAVYAYPVEHYDYWLGQLPELTLPRGMFGENFTTEGLEENSAKIGDRFRIGSTEIMIRSPRIPCFKLGIKFGRDDIIKLFLASRRTGFYLSVVREGEVKAGDEIELIARDDHSITVADVTRIYAHEKDDLETLRRAVEVEALPLGWRNHFRRQLEGLTGKDVGEMRTSSNSSE